MKNAHKLTVAFGNTIPDVLNFTAKDFALDIDLERGETNIVTIDDSSYVYYQSYDTPVPDDILTNAIGCLHDHILNVDESELCQELAEDDYHCASMVHIRDRVECHCSLPDCLVVSVYTFTYYAQNCVVQCYYVTQA